MQLLLKPFAFLLLAASLACISCAKEHQQTGADTDSQGSTGSPGQSSQFKVTVTTIAGKLNDKGNAEDGQGSDARFWNPTKMIYDHRNNMLYVADGTVIRSIDNANQVKTYVPLNKIGGTYNEILDIDLAPGASGSLYITTHENDLWRIEPDGDQGKVINLVNRIYSGNETGPLNSADHFDQAWGLATGANGEVYFFNQSWNTMHRIRFSSPTTGVVEPFAGKPLLDKGGNRAPYPFKDGKGEEATFDSEVSDMASDGQGNIYVADYENDLVRKVTPDGKVTSLFAYKDRLGQDADGPVSTAQSCIVPLVTVTRDGSRVFFVSYGTGSMRNTLSSLRMVRPGLDVTTLVGFGKSNSYGDGDGHTAGLAEVGGIAATPDGKTIYVSEPGNKLIRKVVVE